MSEPDLSRLTGKEIEALLLLHKLRFTTRVADALGLSDSAVKARLDSATKRTGLPRWELATLLAERSNGDSRMRPRSERQVAEPDPIGLEYFSSAGGHETSLGEQRPSFDAWPLPPLPLFPPLTRNRAGGRRLTVGQRLAAIFVWSLIGIMIFCLLIATMTALGNLGLNLRQNGFARI